MKTIFIIGDDSDFSTDLSTYLKNRAFDYQIIETNSFDDITKNIEKAQPCDLVMLDLCMQSSPSEINENALDLLRTLKRGANRPPVVTVTVNSEIEQSAIASGADLCLRKPVGVQEMSDIIQSILIREDLKKQLRPVFVGHVFAHSEIDDLRKAISKAFRRTPFAPYYADVDVQEGHILIDKIIEKIRQTEFGIYDISLPEKPNVFVELGMSMGSGKPYYLIARSGSKIPADLAGLDRIEYVSYTDLSNQIKEKIVKPRLT